MTSTNTDVMAREILALEKALDRAELNYQGALRTERELRGEARRLFAPAVRARRAERDALRRHLQALRGADTVTAPPG